MIKKTQIFIVSLLIFTCGSTKNSVQNKNPKASDFAQSITQEDLKTMLYKYASDEFAGRETGHEGQKIAVEYLKNKYIQMGIPPVSKNQNYFQNVPLTKQKDLTASISLKNTEYKHYEDILALGADESIKLEANEIVFAGYGIDHTNYSDYKDIDVKGKIVLIKGGEPKDEAGNYITTGTSKETKWSSGFGSLSTKGTVAKEKGAKALIFADDGIFGALLPYLKSQQENGGGGKLSLDTSEAGFIYLIASQKLGNELVPHFKETKEAKVVQENFTLVVNKEDEKVVSENVAAFIKGSTLPNEYIIISAHLDHEGIKGDDIYNGADDDGSGTVAILEIAQAFRKAKLAGNGPKRSIIFLHVTGEEKGLLGSRYYTDFDPLVPLASTVANLNIDMIGRTDPKREQGQRNYIYLIGSDKLSTELHNVSEQVNSTCCNVELDYTFNSDDDPNRFYYRSDHYNFAKNNIPVIFYFNGTHADYHKPTDTPDKIEYDLLENRTKLIFSTAWELANRTNRVIVDKAE